MIDKHTVIRPGDIVIHKFESHIDVIYLVVGVVRRMGVRKVYIANDTSPLTSGHIRVGTSQGCANDLSG
jgi:hypothetical protein